MQVLKRVMLEGGREGSRRYFFTFRISMNRSAGTVLRQIFEGSSMREEEKGEGLS